MSRRFVTLIGSLLLALLLSPGAHAQRGGGGTGGGTIYFHTAGQVHTMASDGSSKTPLPANVTGEPSRSLHGGHRWLLQSRDLGGQTYPSGATRRELFAIRDDGNEAFTRQLTDQTDLESNAQVRWVPGDTAVSWVARRWSGGLVVEGGVYVAPILFDIGGNATGLGAQPGSPAVPIGLVPWTANGYYFTGNLAPDLYGHDWAPDGAQLVYDRFSATELWIVPVGGVPRRLVAGSWTRLPLWSPDGSRIAFLGVFPGQFNGVYTIAPAGTGLKNIVKYGTSYSVVAKAWSPTGSHLLYDQFSQQTAQYDVYRASADGTGKANLTSTLGSAVAIAWR